MPKDFAARGPTRPQKRAPTKRKKKAAPSRVLFHGPSFSSGAIVGGAIVVLAAYAPELLDAEITQATDAAAQVESTQPVVEFEFPKLLRESEVIADPTAYEVPQPEEKTAALFYTIQAASFRNGADAETLRADLLLNDLPAQIDTRLVSDKVWFRVTVGPFPRKVEADRAMTRLREMRLIPIWLNDHNG
ncbi:MAG: hypothetical protein GKR90_19770 [Pseudomonadales bacterium]|nr:hypothetical protein [Pseudomonadales bacterium]